MTKTNALVLIATGTEEIEVVTIVDTLRRAKIEVTMASVSALACECSRGVTITADCTVESVMGKSFDVIVVPGGFGGAIAIGESQDAIKLIDLQYSQRKLVVAICAGPTVLEKAGILMKTATKLTSHPTVKDRMQQNSNVEWINERVVVDEEHKLITSQGPGTSLEFALKIIQVLCGRDQMLKTAEPMMLHPSIKL